MKKFLSVLLLLVFLFLLNSGADVSASTTKLTKRETVIAKAFVKSYESSNLSSIKKYIYPGSKMSINIFPNDTYVKVSSIKHTKKYDARTEMNCIFLSCIITISTNNELKIFKGTMGINLKTKGKIVYIYSENTTEANLSLTTTNDITKTQLNYITKYLEKKYGKKLTLKMLASVSQEALNATTDASADLGSTYTYSTSYNCEGNIISGTFSITLNNVSDLTLDYVKVVCYRGPDNENIEYKLVNITWNVKKIKITKGTEKGYGRKDFMTPIFLGSEALGVDYINIVMDSGFDNSFKSKINDGFSPDDFISNKTDAIEITGDVILPIIKGEENYMVFINPGIDDSNLNKIYFKLK